ncbi:hypothetical protein F2Q68_00042506 [Brassica cretica]|uniref:Uncharacterized protein n=1 Tax=Brassica cretica TaxID=69181 RepID=A0A8S9MJ32_BRACR|nr:hypothetical protein F2Q68_00042506 [Brassica cretica]
MKPFPAAPSLSMVGTTMKARPWPGAGFVFRRGEIEKVKEVSRVIERAPERLEPSAVEPSYASPRKTRFEPSKCSKLNLAADVV